MYVTPSLSTGSKEIFCIKRWEFFFSFCSSMWNGQTDKNSSIWFLINSSINPSRAGDPYKFCSFFYSKQLRLLIFSPSGSGSFYFSSASSFFIGSFTIPSSRLLVVSIFSFFQTWPVIFHSASAPRGQKHAVRAPPPLISPYTLIP